MTRCLKYDEHPGDDKHVNEVSLKDATARFKEVVDGLDTTAEGNVVLSEAANQLVPPVVLDTPVHDSNYAYKETGELDPETWGGEAL